MSRQHNSYLGKTWQINQKAKEKILASLRAFNFFESAARAHLIWLQHLEKTLTKGPRGGLPSCLREARMLNQRIDMLGSEDAFDELISTLFYHAERWFQMTDPVVVAELPFLRYVCTCLPDSRASHAEKHGLVFRSDHPFWNAWYPINGAGCQCSVMAVSQSWLDRRGYKVSEKCDFKFPVPDEGFDFNIGKLLLRRRT